MSIQAGIWSFAGEPVDSEMLLRLAHSVREWDSEKPQLTINGPVGMAYLSYPTTAKACCDSQPHRSTNGSEITWDGRLDNRADLIAQLPELNSDSTETSIVAAAWEQWGANAFQKFVGDWAVAIWNSRNRELILGRDYIGVRRLFYHMDCSKVVWSTRLSPLVLCGGRFSLCTDYIAGYLAMWPDAALTPYRHILSVPPGHYVRIRPGGCTATSYWRLVPGIRYRYKIDAEYEEHYRYLFRQAVRRRLCSQSPVLAELSGGFDSSAIVCMADDLLAKGDAEAPALNTFSYYDDNEPEHDDLQYFRIVEQKRGKAGFHANLSCSGIPIEFGSSDFAEIPGFKHRTDVQKALREILHRDEYKVMLSGLGGDEMNGQALNPRVQLADSLLQLHLIKLAQELVSWSLLIRKRPLVHLLAQTIREILPLRLQAQFSPQGVVEDWLDPEFARQYQISARQMGLINGAGFWLPSSRDVARTITNLSRQVSCAGESYCEKRYPYLDRDLVEFLTSIPLDQLLRPGERRRLMRRALVGMLPPEIENRRSKAVMVRCFSVSLERQWEKVEGLFSRALTEHLGYVRSDRMLRALNEMRNGRLSMHPLGLLNALALELWLQDVDARGVIPIRLASDKEELARQRSITNVA